MLKLEGSATTRFRTWLIKFRKDGKELPVELTIEKNGLVGVSIQDSEYVGLNDLRWPHRPSVHVIRTNASELFENSEMVSADRPPGLTAPERLLGLRLVLSDDSITIESVHHEKNLNPSQRQMRKWAAEDPKEPGLAGLMVAMRLFSHLRVFDPPSLLITAYTSKFKEESTSNETSEKEPYIWKTGRKQTAGQTAKDVRAIAFLARSMVCGPTAGGSPSDVVVFVQRRVSYIGMTARGFECWMLVLQKVRDGSK